LENSSDKQRVSIYNRRAEEGKSRKTTKTRGQRRICQEEGEAKFEDEYSAGNLKENCRRVMKNRSKGKGGKRGVRGTKDGDEDFVRCQKGREGNDEEKGRMRPSYIGEKELCFA